VLALLDWVTANHSRADLRRAMEAGVDDFSRQTLR